MNISKTVNRDQTPMRLLKKKKKKKKKKGIKCERYLWDQVLEGVHDLGALGLLVVGEATSDDDNSRKHNTQVQL